MADNLEYKCPSCGGAIAFDSKLQKMKCPYCDLEMDMESFKSMDEHLEEVHTSEKESSVLNSTEKWQEGDAQLNVFVCNSCGGELIADENTVATACPYCDNPVVLKERLIGDLKPKLVIPFKLDKKAAKEALNRHIQGKRLLPKVFKDQNHIDEIKGIYVPFWLFDITADANLKYNTESIRMWSDSQYNYREISYYSVLREGQLNFTHLPVDGSKKISNTLMESIEPFDFSEAVDFQTAYLAGYLADRYDVTAEESIDSVEDRAKTSTARVFENTVKGYDTLRIEDSSIQLYRNSEAMYVLYPVWFLNTTWNKKRYTFAMNGQTGKFVGDLPLDKGAYWKYFVLFSIIAAIVLYIIVWLINYMFGIDFIRDTTWGD
jgi:hypothetical protein